MGKKFRVDLNPEIDDSPNWPGALVSTTPAFARQLYFRAEMDRVRAVQTVAARRWGNSRAPERLPKPSETWYSAIESLARAYGQLAFDRLHPTDTRSRSLRPSGDGAFENNYRLANLGLGLLGVCAYAIEDVVMVRRIPDDAVTKFAIELLGDAEENLAALSRNLAPAMVPKRRPLTGIPPEAEPVWPAAIATCVAELKRHARLFAPVFEPPGLVLNGSPTLRRGLEPASS